MKPDTRNINTLWSSLLVEELVRCGVKCFCVASGSRSSPLIAAVAQHENKSIRLHFDERGAGYFAVGYARATGRPAVCITTSGTAVANVLPAVVEASNAHLPLIVLSADRPPELRDAGANQAMDHVKIFGDFARWYTELPCPTLDVPAPYVLTTADEAYNRATGPSAGPVHINCMLREPLAPDEEKFDAKGYLARLSEWENSRAPHTTVAARALSPAAGSLDEVVATVGQSKKGVLVVGTLMRDADRRAVSRFTEKLGWPTLPDITSGLRLGPQGRSSISHYDQLLLGESFAGKHAPDTVIHIGGPVVSKRLLQYLAASDPEHYIQIQDHEHRQDPNHQVTCRIESSISDCCDQLARKLTSVGDAGWLKGWASANASVETAILEHFETDDISEPAVASTLSSEMEAEHGLFVASSMSIRELDMYGATDGAAVRVAANRGASGIDGTIASALGYAQGLQRPVTLLIGDLAFLHDLNSLAMVRTSPEPITMVLVNNNGGGIYSFLPIAAHQDLFEKYFGTPHNMTFAGLSDIFGIKYSQPGTMSAFANTYKSFATSGESGIIEIVTDREVNHAFHVELQGAIRGAMT